MILLLLHGLGGNGRLWDRVAALSDDRVLAPDLAGHGTAPALPDYAVEAYAQDLSDRLRGELDHEPVRIIGHSMGGAVGLALAARETRWRVEGVVGLGIPESAAGSWRRGSRGARASSVLTGPGWGGGLLSGRHACACAGPY